MAFLAAALGPFALALAVQAKADAQPRLDAHLARDGNDLLEFLQFLHHQHDRPAELHAHKGHADELRVLVAIAYNQTARLVLQGQTGE